ncbi:LRR domain containing protein [Trema orientale]|uniref:LRR domain containing protein n=1 Tax=Trema orientale TaxID=63057 RepID=A0A2P5EVF1_TREOI|nr:LRR domain containing protein [Trema orientale]
MEDEAGECQGHIGLVLVQIFDCGLDDELDIQESSRGSFKLRTIPSSVGNLSQLQYLWLSGNNLNGQLPSTLKNLAKLTSLRLEDTGLTGELPFGLGNLRQLQTLYTRGNRFNGQIPSSLGNLSQLQDLELHQESLDGTIPSSVGNLSQLQYLWLSGNNLNELCNSGYRWRFTTLLVGMASSSTEEDGRPTRQAVGAAVRQLETRIELQFSPAFSGTSAREDGEDGRFKCNFNNCSPNIAEDSVNNSPPTYSRNSKFSGTIPSSVGNLSQLQYLWLSGNNLNGQLPSTLKNLAKLTSLRLEDTGLTGELPFGLGNLRQLQTL